ncbi:MAG: protein-L-isoaspartate(D-aspartate) O-methyltransferase [Planctomycetota bacterium]
MSKKNFNFTFLFLGLWIFLFFFNPPPPKSAPPLNNVVDSDHLLESQEVLLKKQRIHLVDEYIRPVVSKETILQVMKKVPRHLFMPEQYQSVAYENRPWPIGYGQSISQPSLVALMTEVVDISPGEKVLEIGTGSGYQAAILLELGAIVCTIEGILPLAQSAEKRLTELYGENIKVKCGTGYDGWKEEAPFSAIIVTSSVEEIPDSLIQQLRPEGKMVIPVGPSFDSQELILVYKTKEGEIQTKNLMTVRFVPLVSK